MTAITPSFDKPPIVETVLGVEFVPIAKWGIPHFGLFWEEIRDDYPEFEVKAPLRSQIERFGKDSFGQPTANVQIVTEPEVRCWFIHSAKDRLIQIQRDRFTHNWRRMNGSASYPRYQSLRDHFEAEWGRFSGFFESHALGAAEVQQCEVTYINHIDRGECWQSFSELGQVLRFWSGLDGTELLSSPETAQLNVSFALPEQKGRLHVAVQHAFRPIDGVETLQLTLTARGSPASSETKDLLAWFDLAREWVVCGFADVTTAKMHGLWQRRS